MEAYNSSSYSSSSNSSYMNIKQVYPLLHQSSHNSWLHSVRRTPSKPWKKTPPVAPMPPTPVKVYKVDAINFRDVVQQLTGAPEHKPQPQPQPRQQQQQVLQSNNIARTESHVVPNVPPKQNQSSGDTCGTKWYQDFFFGMNSQGTNNNDASAMAPGFLGMNLLSPTSYSSFCLFPPLSPRGVTGLEGKAL